MTDGGLAPDRCPKVAALRPSRRVAPRVAGGPARADEENDQFLRIRVLRISSDPEALNACMHTFPEMIAELTLASHIVLRKLEYGM